MKRVLAFAVLLLTLAGFATAGTLTGTLAYPNTAITLENATLTFALSQTAFVSGSFLVVPQSINCYTTSSPAGSVVGLPDPLVLPSLTPSVVTGSLPGGTYYVEISYWYGGGGAGNESLPSPEQSVLLSGAGELTGTAPAVQPANALGYNVLIASTSGAETLQIHVTGWGNWTQSTPLSAGASPQTTNTTACVLRFTDELIPTGTWYNTTITTAAGSTLPGFPQRWQLWGGSAATINLSNGFPTSYQTTLFPTPIQANPPSSSAQSINSALTVNGLLTVSNLKLTSALNLTGSTLLNAVLNGANNGNSVTLLNWQVSSSQIAGNGTDQTVYTYTIPANTLGAGKGIRITAGLQHGTGSSNTVGKIFFGGTSVAATTAFPQNGFVNFNIVVINNPNVQNAQEAISQPIIGTGTTVMSGLVTTLLSVDTTQPVVVKETCNNPNTDTCTGQGFLVELIQ